MTNTRHRNLVGREASAVLPFLSLLPKRFVTAALVLTVILVLALPLFLLAGFERYGADGLRSAVLAFLVCWLSGLGCLGVVAIGKQTGNPMAGTLCSILIRTGIPLAALALAPFLVPRLWAQGFQSMLLAYFLITLTLDALLSAGLVQDVSANSKSPLSVRPEAR